MRADRSAFSPRRHAIWSRSDSGGLTPRSRVVEHEDTDGGRQVRSSAGAVDDGHEPRDAGVAVGRSRFQPVPEGRFQRDAGPMAGNDERVFDDGSRVRRRIAHVSRSCGPTSLAGSRWPSNCRSASLRVALPIRRCARLCPFVARFASAKAAASLRARRLRSRLKLTRSAVTVSCGTNRSRRPSSGQGSRRPS